MVGDMSEVEFIVRGSHRVHLPAERGTVALTISREGPEPDAVFSVVAAGAESLSQDIKKLHRPASGPVTWWSSERLLTGSRRPWNDKGKQLPLVYWARVSFRVKFSDFDELNRFAARVAQRDDAELDGTSWTLTDKRRTSVEAEVRSAAVRDARKRAQVYADALDLGRVRPVAVADPGMLSSSSQRSVGTESRLADMSLGAPPAAAAQIDQTPREITVQHDVEARFVATQILTPDRADG